MDEVVAMQNSKNVSKASFMFHSIIFMIRGVTISASDACKMDSIVFARPCAKCTLLSLESVRLKLKF